jgi:ribosomal silencing factor RsfS
MKMEQTECSKTSAYKIQTSRNYPEKKTDNTLRLGYTNQSANTEIITVCSQNHTKHINALCGQNAELLNVKPGGTYSDHWT